MKDFSQMTETERAEVRRMIDALHEHAAALETMLTLNSLTPDVQRNVEWFTDGYHCRYSVYSSELPNIVGRLKDRECPDCGGTAEYCDCL